MIKSLKIRFILVAIFLVISIIYCMPNIFEPQGSLKKYLPSDKIHLGLDLKGGMHLLLELDMAKMMQNLSDRQFTALKDAMIRDGVRFLALDKKENTVAVAVKAEQKESFTTLVGKEFPLLSRLRNKTGEGDTFFVDFVLSESGSLQGSLKITQ